MRVDVVLTTNAEPEPLALSLKWLSHQTMRDWRAIVVVDGEGADAEGAAKAAGIDDDRVTVLRGPDRGEAAARNTGLDAAEGEHVLFLRAGERLLRRALARLLAASDRGGLGGGVGVAAAPTADPGSRIGAAVELPDQTIGLHELLDGFAPEPSAVLTRRDAIGRRRFGVNLGRFSAVDFWLRLAEDGVRWRSTESVTSYVPRGAAVTIPDQLAAAEEISGILSRAYKRAAARGWDEADLSERRERAARAAWGMELATLAALGDDDPRRAAATELFRPFAVPGIVTPESAADAALRALFAWGRVPAGVDGSTERTWAKPIHEWWSRCVSEKWAAGALSNRALRALADRLVSPEDAAGQLIEELGMPGQLYVTGSDRSAVAVADAAALKGWRVGLVCFGPRGWAEALAEASGDRYSVVGPDAVTDERDPLVIGAAADEVAIARFQGRPNVMRYAAARRELISRATNRLRAAWPKRGSSAETALDDPDA